VANSDFITMRNVLKITIKDGLSSE